MAFIARVVRAMTIPYGRDNVVLDAISTTNVMLSDVDTWEEKGGAITLHCEHEPRNISYCPFPGTVLCRSHAEAM